MQSGLRILVLRAGASWRGTGGLTPSFHSGWEGTCPRSHSKWLMVWRGQEWLCRALSYTDTVGQILQGLCSQTSHPTSLPRTSSCPCPASPPETLAAGWL